MTIQEQNNQRRKLLKMIIANLAEIDKATDEELKDINLRMLSSINITVFDFLKILKIDCRERHGRLVYAKKDYTV